MNNESGKKKIRTFTDLDAWKEAHQLVLIVYTLTKSFPREEVFGLVQQIRRAVVSISSNIAEGFSRQTYQDKIRFYFMAQGSVTEVQDQLLIARDVAYITPEDFKRVEQQTIIVHKIVNGLIRGAKNIIRDS